LETVVLLAAFVLDAVVFTEEERFFASADLDVLGVLSVVFDIGLSERKSFKRALKAF
jgi:hypothetical protein